MRSKFSRRTFLAGAGATFAGTAFAETSDPIFSLLQDENRAEWSDGFDSLSPAKQVRDVESP